LRVLITGSKGQLGRALGQALAKETIFNFDLPEMDITDYRQTSQVITDLQPEVVIHCAAFTNVDGCETDPDTAYQVNALGTQNVALACQRAGSAMVYISTNEVFDGTKTGPYLEFDQPNPINAYGRSKLAGEQYVQMLTLKFYIVRISWLYGEGGDNFVRKMIRRADEQRILSVVDDEIASPTYAKDLAQALAQLVRHPQYGIYHLTNSGACSRYEWAREIMFLTGREHIPVRPISSKEYVRASRPPLNGQLRNYCAEKALGITLRPWREALEDFVVSNWAGLVKGT